MILNQEIIELNNSNTLLFNQEHQDNLTKTLIFSELKVIQKQFKNLLWFKRMSDKENKKHLQDQMFWVMMMLQLKWQMVNYITPFQQEKRIIGRVTFLPQLNLILQLERSLEEQIMEELDFMVIIMDPKIGKRSNH